jgi:LuxR family transcriptional regulator, maltose regulon positive regulatory protein
LESIVHTRLLQKSLPIGIIERRMLFRLLSENINKSLILICAPAGYGKTTLVQDFISKKSIKFSWLHVHPDMDNFYSFITYLTHSLQKLDSAFGKNTMALIEDYRERFNPIKNTERIVNDIITVFINEFVSVFKDDVTLVIDDLGNISNSEWQAKCFNMLFENIPSNMHLIITSRQVPVFNLSVLKAKRNILNLGSAELAFKLDETEELLKSNYDVTTDENEVKLLRDSLGGWITGIHLVIQSSGNEFPKLRLDKMIIMEDIYNYFTEDIFNNLEEEIQNFLLLTSILESFSPELCDYVFNTTNSGKIIEDLLNKNIFIYIDTELASRGQPSYTYHLLFRKFLNSKLKDKISAQEMKDFFSKAAAFYSESKDYLRVINYSLAAGETSTALKLIEDNFQNYFDSGKFESAWRWFEDIGDELISDNALLLYYKSLMLRFYKGDIEGSLSYLDKVIGLSEQAKNYGLYIKAVISKSRNLISSGRINDAIKNIESVPVKKIKGESASKLNFISAFAFYQNGDYDKSLAMLDKAVEELENSPETKDSANTKLDIYNMYGHIYLIRGDYSKSIAYYEQVVKKSKRVIDKYETYCNLILLHAQSGKFEKALEYLEEAKSITETISIPIFRITYLLALQSVRFEFGDYEGSIGILEEINRIAVNINHKYYIFLSYSLIGDSYFYLNKLSKAEEYYDLAFKYVNDESRLEKIQYSFTKALLIKKESQVAEIEEVLTEAYEYYTENKFTYNKTQAAFHLADYYYKTKNYKTSLVYLTEALNISHEKEYSSFLQRDFSDMKYLYDFAAANNIQKDFIKSIMNSLVSKKNTLWISEEARKRLTNSIEHNYDIRLSAFGKGEVSIRGKIIDDAFWSKKKWKIIFIYLLLSPKKVLTKDKIIDVFYPDTQIESAENIFHQMVSKFRSIVKTGAHNEKSVASKSKSRKVDDSAHIVPSLIIYEDKLLKINDDFMLYIDSDEFEQIHKKTATVKNTEKKLALLREAIDLYKGDFLEGNYETWAEELRTKYQSYFISMSEEIIKIFAGMKDYESVLEYSEKLIKHDSLNLIAYEHAIKSYEALNKLKQAREKYSRLIKSYDSEYGEKLPESFTSKISTTL